MQQSGKILVVGASIGGLVLGRALESAGFDYEIFEAASELGPVGAGILVQTGAMLALRGLGLESAVEQAGHKIIRASGKTQAGKLLQTTRMDFLESELGAPVIAIHRGRLHGVLLGNLERGRVRTGMRFVRYNESDLGITGFFADGSSVEGSLLIGADGLYSVVREQLLGPTALRYSGYTSWRGVAPGAAFMPEHEVVEMWGRGARFGMAPIGDAAHPTTPNLGQGGCMAIEDAVVLAHCLKQSDSHEAAFAAYERRRVRRTTRIVEASFKFGKIAQLEGRLSVWLRNLLMRATPERIVRSQLRGYARFSLDSD